MPNFLKTYSPSNTNETLWNYLSKLHELEKEGDPSEPVTIQHTKVKGGSIETTTVMGKNPQQGGLLEKIFLGEAVDVEAEVIK